jgi:hypothetical protein
VEGHTPWAPGSPDPQPIVVLDLANDQSLVSYLPVFREEGIQAMAFIPLVSLNRVIGKFMLYDGAPHDLSPEELQLGLGLAIARHLVELYGGDIRATSPGPGRGTTVQLRLPAGRSCPQAPVGRGAEEIREDDVWFRPDGRRVLVVDDHHDSRELLAALLASHGAEVLPCDSAAAALAHWPPGPPNSSSPTWRCRRSTATSSSGACGSCRATCLPWR